ncbi:vesicle coat protein [Lithospermum erythrorhizon]|uniref:Coatomer subunit zeta n=1 Tax=Lithospermum erythrorhizon TaxID=34254 RepID=A0AAV3NPZ4_LITER
MDDLKIALSKPLSVVKYYTDDWPTNAAKLPFEKNIFTKTVKTNARIKAEITMLEDNLIVYKFVHDLHLFVTGGDENELILANVLHGFHDAVTLLLRNNVDQREALENPDLVLYALTRLLMKYGNVIAVKVVTHSMDDGGSLTLGQALATAREHFTRSLLS